MSWRELWFQVTNYMFWPVVFMGVYYITRPRDQKEASDGVIQSAGLPILVYDREETVQRTDDPETSGSDIDGDERILNRPANGLAEYSPIAPDPEPLPGSAAGN